MPVEVRPSANDEIVEYADAMTFSQEPVYQMAANKAGSSRHQV
jgi:hypothetical protein